MCGIYVRGSYGYNAVDSMYVCVNRHMLQRRRDRCTNRDPSEENTELNAGHCTREHTKIG